MVLSWRINPDEHTFRAPYPRTHTHTKTDTHQTDREIPCLSYFFRNLSLFPSVPSPPSTLRQSSIRSSSSPPSLPLSLCHLSSLCSVLFGHSLPPCLSPCAPLHFHQIWSTEQDDSLKKRSNQVVKWKRENDRVEERKRGRRKGKRLRSKRKKQEGETLPKLAQSDGSGADLIKHLCRNACWEVRLMARAVRVCIIARV